MAKREHLKTQKAPVVEIAKVEADIMLKRGSLDEDELIAFMIERAGLATNSETRLIKAKFELKALKARQGPPSKIAALEATVAYLQALKKGMMTEFADVTGAETYLRVLEKNNAPILAVADAKKKVVELKWSSRSLFGKHDSRKQLFAEKAKLKVLKDRGGNIIDIAKATGNVVYQKTFLKTNRDVWAKLEGKKAYLRVVREGDAPIAEIAKAEGEVAKYKAMKRLAEKDWAEAVQIGAEKRRKILEEGDPVAREAIMEWQSVYEQVLSKGGSKEEARLLGARVYLDVLKNKKASRKQIAEAEKRVKRLTEAFDKKKNKLKRLASKQ